MPSPADALGWVATAVFAGSYFLGRPAALRRGQMCGAALWVGYGILVQAPPVVAANLLVLAAAAWTARREALRPQREPERHEDLVRVGDLVP
jgi:hypothetical protein